MVGEPGVYGALVGGFPVGSSDPAADVIRGDRGGTPGSQPYRRVRFPLRIEPPDLVEFRGRNLLRERPAGPLRPPGRCSLRFFPLLALLLGWIGLIVTAVVAPPGFAWAAPGAAAAS